MNFQPDDFRLASEWALLAVKNMSAAQVPHGLIKIRGSSDRRLTPWNERAIHRELNQNEQLRQATLDFLDAPAFQDSPARDRESSRAGAAILFLSRPQGWEEQAGHLLLEASLEEARQDNASLQEELVQARAQVDKLRRQAKEARRAASTQSKRAAARLREDLERAKRRNQDLQSEFFRQRQKTQRLEEELEASFDELTLADARVEELRKLLGKERSAASTLSPDGVGYRWSRVPLEAARMLDQMVRSWEVGSDVGIEPAESLARLELPAGVDPRSGQAVQWLYDHAPRLTLVVDGWNVAYYWNYHQGISDDPDQGTVAFITNKLGMLAQYSVGRHRVSFYLDSRYANGVGPEWENRFQSGPLTGYYVEYADDDIADQANRRAGAPVVVITSDKELAERCRAHGALVLASEGLAEWMAESPV